MRARLPEAHDLFHKSVQCFARMEKVGLRVDVDYIDRTIEKTERKIKKIEKRLKEDEIYQVWRKRFGEKTKISSRQQLGTVLFDVMKFKPSKQNAENFKKKKRYKADANELEYLNLKFVKDFLLCSKLKDLVGKYLRGIKHEVVEGYAHPFINLHTAWTYRGSVSEFNSQNIPARDEESAKIVRSAFIVPSDDYVIVETDFKGIEVSVSACYHKDPKFIHDITVPGADMHRDTAMKIFKLTKDQVAKDVRSHVKNKFVFPEFYGDWYMSCAQSLWTAIERFDLKTESGVSLFEHLASKGIHELGNQNPDEDVQPGTFEFQVKKVEKDFWQRRFKVYTQWKKDWWEKYCEKGYFDLLTGFRCSGVFNRKQVCNTPIQGSAFHCLLWTLIRMDSWLRKNKMKSRICWQIHDSIIAYVHRKEYDDYVAKIQKVISEELLKAWSWIIVPMTAEIEMSETNWFEKKRII